LTIVGGLAGRESVIMLDRIIYTTDLSPSAEPPVNGVTSGNPDALSQSATVPSHDTMSQLQATSSSEASRATQSARNQRALRIDTIAGAAVGIIVTTILAALTVRWRWKERLLSKEPAVVPFEMPPGYDSEVTFNHGDEVETQPPEYSSDVFATNPGPFAVNVEPEDSQPPGTQKH